MRTISRPVRRPAWRCLVLCLVMLLGSACSEVTSPLPSSQVEIESWNFSDETPDPGETRAEAVLEGLHIVGRFDRFRMGCGFGLEAEARLRGRELEVRVRYSALSVACVRRRGPHFGYDAQVRDLPAGPLKLRVIHIVRDWGSQVVLETEVEQLLRPPADPFSIGSHWTFITTESPVTCRVTLPPCMMTACERSPAPCGDLPGAASSSAL